MVALSEEQTMLRDMARDWAFEQSPVTAFRKLRDAGERRFDPAAWSQMAEMGWTGIIVPEDHGGLDFGHRSLGVVLEELGRTLTASPLLSTAIAASAITLGGSDATQGEWLPRFAEGAATGALAVDEGPRHDPAKVDTSAANGKLSGRKQFVQGGAEADVLIVSAAQDGAVQLFAIPADADGVSREALDMMDSRDSAHVTFNNVAIQPDWRLEGGAQLLETVLDRGRIYLAAEMLGIAQQAFDTTVEYLKVREQFGQPIGAFQALQHRAAEMFREIELTRSCVEAALDSIDEGSEDIAQLASLAKARVCDTLNLVSREMIQMHGGIGMTDAHDAGFYLKRARVTEALLGNAAFHRDRYAALLGF